jgi:protocatechuate 3,4-dioxygenase beta subunit
MHQTLPADSALDHHPDLGDDLDDHDRGLVFDLGTIDRRRMLKMLGFGGVSAGLFTIIGCSPTAATGSPSASGSASATEVGASCALIPEETAGPFPGDGSNGPDILAESGVVRKDIRSSFGSSTTVAEGIPLTIQLTIQDDTTSCTPIAGAAVYAWHCNREGEYSMYSQNVTDENYLRGVQAAGDDGVVTFTSIFPACYPGRWPHIHFEVYPSLETATDVNNKIATSQIALPKDACDLVFATAGYEQSPGSMQEISLASDNVFGDDGGALQIGTMTGSVAEGYTVALTVSVDPG